MLNNKEKVRQAQQRYKAKNPWIIFYYLAKHRVKQSKGHYFSRGLIFDMAVEDFKEMWFRDKAYEMKKPSVDRIDGFIGYIKSNCRFLELEENLRRPKSNSRPRIKNMIEDEKTKIAKVLCETAQNHYTNRRKTIYNWDILGKESRNRYKAMAQAVLDLGYQKES